MNRGPTGIFFNSIGKLGLLEKVSRPPIRRWNQPALMQALPSRGVPPVKSWEPQKKACFPFANSLKQPFKIFLTALSSFGTACSHDNC
jgi:hypothetical protein